MGKKQALNNPVGFSIFATGLASLLDAGFTPFGALEALRNAGTDGAEPLDEVLSAMSSGSTIGEAFLSADYYPPDFCALVDAAERTGRLGHALRDYASYLTVFQTAKKSFRGALTYPLVMTTGIIAAIFAFGGFLVPGFLFEMAKKKGVALSEAGAPGMFLSALSSLVGWGGPIVTVLMCVGLIYWIWGPGRSKVEGVFLAVPAMKALFRRLSWASYMKMLSMCLSSGLILTEAVETCEGMAPKEVANDDVLNELASGISLSEVWENMGADGLVCLLSETGTRGGNLPAMFDSLSLQYMSGMEQEIKQTAAIIEPIVIAALAVVGGTLAGSLMLTVMKLASLGN